MPVNKSINYVRGENIPNIILLQLTKNHQKKDEKTKPKTIKNIFFIN